jgi:hypothetical protein
MNQYHKYVGLDVHKERNAVASVMASAEIQTQQAPLDSWNS